MKKSNGKDLTIPQTMQALELTEFSGIESLKLVRRPVPIPKPGELLVRVLASPINPSDVMYCRGLYGIAPKLPIIPGFEACVEVVKSGGGWLANRMVGKRVASGGQKGDGFWAEYAVVPALSCLPLPDKVSNEQGASALVNPVSAYAMVELFQKSGSKAMIQSAAASQLGKMVIRLCVARNIPLINIVHRQELVDSLKSMGAVHVLDSTSAGFDENLKELAVRLDATYAIDAVAGDLTRRVLSAMPRGTIYVYGALSGKPCSADPRDLIFNDKRMDGFWLSKWLKNKHPLLVLMKLRKVASMLDSEFETNVAVRLTLEETALDLKSHMGSASKGKILILPNKSQ